MFSQNIIDKLQNQRRKTFPEYNHITLDRGALTAVAHLLLNPDCRSDIDILTLPGEKIKLSSLGEHVITAAPSTLAQYASRHGIKHFTKYDILKCFALDHIIDVAGHGIDIKKNPQYALAHILNLSKVVKKYVLEGKNTVDVVSGTEWGKVRFNKIIVPKGILVERNEMVFHHFGVVVGEASDEKLSLKIMKLQKQDLFMNAIFRDTGRRDVVIDFSKVSIFHKDIVAQVLDHGKAQSIEKPQDIENGRIKFQN